MFGRKSSSQLSVFRVVLSIWVLTLVVLCDGEQNGVNGDGDQNIVINPTSPMMADDDDNGKESIGYAAGKKKILRTFSRNYVYWGNLKTFHFYFCEI